MLHKTWVNRMTNSRVADWARLVTMALVCCCVFASTSEAAPDAAYQTAIDSPIRTEKDRTMDASRRPIDFLTLTQVKPGMTVLDVAAGAGYTSQLLALAVGPQGKLFAQISKPSAALDARLSAHPQSNIKVLIQSFEEVYPSDLPKADMVTLVLSYHDIVNLPIDRTKMNLAIFNALKIGGHLVILDHAATEGAGLTVTASLHRIDEQTVIQELTKVGFKLEAKSLAWRNAADTREVQSTKMETTSDRFALRFVKP